MTFSSMVFNGIFWHFYWDLMEFNVVWWDLVGIKSNQQQLKQQQQQQQQQQNNSNSGDFMGFTWIYRMVNV